jgi:hypothetical protein
VAKMSGALQGVWTDSSIDRWFLSSRAFACIARSPRFR